MGMECGWATQLSGCCGPLRLGVDGHCLGRPGSLLAALAASGIHHHRCCHCALCAGHVGQREGLPTAEPLLAAAAAALKTGSAGEVWEV